MFRFTMLALALMASGLLFAQTEMRGDLKRRAHLGVQMAAGAQGERVVQGLTAGAAAEKGGVEVGDVVLEVQGVSLGDAAAFSRMMAGLRAGDSARMKVRRGEEEKELTLTMGPRPTESAEDFGIVYDVVEHGEARLRSIATRPSAKGRYPAVFFIQGLTAASTEFYPGRSNTVQELLYGLTRRGFVTFRCEKSGCGDSTGEAASEVGFDFETEGFRKALAKLKTYDFVDPDRVYIFGHSMGGVMAPLVAPKKEVAGIVVYGTGLRPWNEYMVTNSRRQMKLSGVKASMADEMLRAHEKIHHLTLVEKWSL